MNMNFKLNVNTEIELNTVNDLKNLRLVMEVNGLDKPNFSELARRLGVDRRTVKKYYEGNIEVNRKPKKSKIDDYYDLISSLLSAESDQIFHYKSHLYRYLVREHNLLNLKVKKMQLNQKLLLANKHNLIGRKN